MMKKLVVLLACLGLAFQLTSCTSKNSQADSEVAADYDSADLEKLEGDEALEIAGDDSLASDQLPEDALGETTTTTTAESTHAEKADIAASTETMPADPFAETTEAVPPHTADTSTTVVDTTVASTPDNTAMVESSTATSSSTTVVDNSSEEAPKKASVPLQKVATAPWKVGKTWYNTVYFARPGDSLASISQMIYGADKTKELKKGNPALASRDVRPGDKVYYSSPHRAEDSSKIVTYYEDNGMAPEVYVAKSGDNIKKVSKDLLGYDNAWKEVWSSNAVDSKGNIAEGTELRYWRSIAAAAPVQQHQELTNSASHEAQAPSLPSHEEMQQQAQNEIPPPPMPEQQPMEMAPPPPPPPQEIAHEMAPPPPPPPVEAVNPPAPPQQHHVAEEAPTGMDNDTTMALAVVGLAAAGLAVLIVMRKKRKQKELEQQAMDNTHVGT